MRNLIAAVFGLGMFVTASAQADHFGGSNASAYEVQTPQSVNESTSARSPARGRDSQSVFHPGHTPANVDDNSPAGRKVGAPRSDRVGGTARGSGGDNYSVFGFRFSNPGFPASVNESDSSRRQ